MIKNICSCEQYEKNGEKKLSWKQIGTLIEKDGKQYIKLFMFPGQFYSVFENEKESEF